MCFSKAVKPRDSETQLLKPMLTLTPNPKLSQGYKDGAANWELLKTERIRLIDYCFKRSPLLPSLSLEKSGN